MRRSRNSGYIPPRPILLGLARPSVFRSAGETSRLISFSTQPSAGAKPSWKRCAVSASMPRRSMYSRPFAPSRLSRRMIENSWAASPFTSARRSCTPEARFSGTVTFAFAASVRAASGKVAPVTRIRKVNALPPALHPKQ